jgi:phage terminase large subunit-like protein
VARSRSAPVRNESAEIVQWYRDLIDEALPPSDLEWEPVKIGPTWQWDNGWVLPDASLGWEMLAWCGTWLRGKHGPWQFTAEQARFLLWFYALDSDGSFLYHSAALQRLKGWGKDPIAACISAAAMVAPVSFDHWEGDRPVGRDEEQAWIQLVAVSLEQTQNTMKLFPSLISAEARKHYGIQVGKTNLWAMGDTRQVQAVTNSPLALEGGRPTLVVRNETQNWLDSNGGHDMAGAIEGNAAKSADGAARVLDIFNAYRPGQDSVAQRLREGFEATQGPDATSVSFGLLYDSLEAPPEAPLTVDAAPSVVRSIRGDARWLTIKRIIQSITNPANPPSESRRKWYNQITAAEDSWTTPQEWDACSAQLNPSDDDQWGVFFDGSKSDDATAVCAARISDGFRVRVGTWTRPPHLPRDQAWIFPRDRVDEKVQEFMDSHAVVGFLGDPSHATDDEDGDRYWDGLMDEWHRRYKDRLKVWAFGSHNSGAGHSIIWDMASPAHVKEFTEACGRTLQEIQEGALLHDGDALLRRHVLNARRAPNKFGVSISKRHRESKDKIDAAVCMVGAGLVRRMYLNSKKNERERTGEAFFRRRW